MIHVVEAGESVDSIAEQYGISPFDLAFDNQIEYPYPLVVGQALWVQRNDSNIDNRLNKTFFGYAYPFIEEDTLLASLTYLDQLYIFSYGYTEEGELLPIADEEMLAAAVRFLVTPVLVLTPFSLEGTFSNQLVNVLLENKTVQNTLVSNLLTVMTERGYVGVNIDFEFILLQDKDAYVEFIAFLSQRMHEAGFFVTVAVPPKTSDDQTGLLYEGIDYQGLGESADGIFLMTYEWGYT